MFKKVTASFLAATLLAIPAQAAFSDVGETHPNYDAIQFMQDSGVVEGYQDGTYQPDKTINRAEFTKIVMEAVYPGQAVVDSCFDDVAQKDWFSDYICNAKVKGIVGGYEDGTFKPNDEINFVEASQIINVAYGYAPPIEMIPEEEEDIQDTTIYTELEERPREADETPGSTDESTDGSTGLANPASVYCTENKGTLEIKDEEDGQVGYCTLEDGEVCEEWAYYRKECGVDDDANDDTNDNEEITDEDWFKPYVDSLADEYAIPTTITTFDHKLTRGEMAEMIYRLQKPNPFKESLTYNEIKTQNLQAQVQDLNLIDDDAILGAREALVVMVEFSDYECPFCKSFASTTMSQIKEKYVDTNQMNIIFRDFPLSFHEQAKPAANAAECARSLGDDSTYFEFHDKLYASDTLNKETYETFASELELDSTLFAQCLDNETYYSEIENDVLQGTSFGVQGTPSFFINGTMISGAQAFEEFEKVIDAELAKIEAAKTTETEEETTQE